MSYAIANGLASFGPEQAMQTATRAEIGSGIVAVRDDALRQVGGDADVHRVAIAVCHDAYPATNALAVHCPKQQEAGPRVKPGATG